MNGHPVQSMSDLMESGIKEVEAHAREEPAIHDLDASKLHITHTTTPRQVPKLNSEEVWSVKACTDHMVTVKWTDDAGWHAPEIKPYGPLTIMPTASCLHYATQCFEGMKVYRGYDGKLRLFRPDKNCARLVLSSTRVALPTFSPAELEKILKAFLALDGPREFPRYFARLTFADETRLATQVSPRNLSLSTPSDHWKWRTTRCHLAI
jgi:branched-chain amino acid aminotransferase